MVTHPLSGETARDVAALKKIRHVVVDVVVFGGAPQNIWTHFPVLETMTVVFYAQDSVDDCGDFYACDHHARISGIHVHLHRGRGFDLAKPYEKSKMGTRANIITKLVLQSLVAASKEVPMWKVPELTVLYRLTGRLEFDEPIQKAAEAREMREKEKLLHRSKMEISVKANLEQDSATAGSENSALVENDDYDPDFLDDDSEYLHEIHQVISHPSISQAQMDHWKRQYGPSPESELATEGR